MKSSTRAAVGRLLSALAVVVAAGLLGGTDWGREQVKISVTRQSMAATELYFKNLPDRPACDPSKPQAMDFVVNPGESLSEDLRYTVSISFSGNAAPSGRVIRGVVSRVAGPTVIAVPIAEPTAQEFTVVVQLADTGQRLSLTCKEGLKR